MSDNLLRLVPLNPEFLPSQAQAAEAMAAFQSLAPLSHEVRVVHEPEVTFVDAGSNFEAVRCPGCGTDLTVGWWQGEMDRASVSRFDDLDIRTPCCGAATTLNDLDYVWPQAFGRWWLQAMNPGRQKLSDEEIEFVETVLGCSLREVWSHY